jgi:hypothetical protein
MAASSAATSDVGMRKTMAANK